MRDLITDAAAVVRLDAAEQFVRRFTPATEIVVVASTRGAADDFVRRVVVTGRAAFGLHRFSLTQLASHLARRLLADNARVAITRLAQEAMAASTTFRVMEEGGLPYFKPVATFPGFARSVASTITELRLAGVREGELLNASVSASDVARLLSAFDAQLEEQRASDIADLFHVASAAAVDTAALLKGAPLLLLDVPIRSAAEAMFVSGLLDSRTETFATVLAADERTGAFFRSAGFQELARPANEPRSSLDRLRSNLFATVQVEPAVQDQSVDLSSAPGEAREAVEIARRIYAEARRGVPFDEIAILLRSPHHYMPHVETALRRADIPFYSARSVARPDPSGRAFLALLACAAEDYSARRFAEYVSLGQVPREPTAPDPLWVPPEDDVLYVTTSEDLPPEADDEPSENEPLRAPWRWEELLVEAAVIGGADRWERRLRGLVEQFVLHRSQLQRDEPGSPRIEALENDLARIRELASFATPLVRKLEGLRACSTWGEWLLELRAIATVALRKPRRVLKILSELNPMARVGPVGIADVQGVLNLRLLTVPRQAPSDRYGRVFVGALDDARGRAFRVVLVPGLAERAFPRPQREDPMLLDSVRREIPTKLSLLDDRVADERLLLQIAAGAATERIAFSYPRVEIAEARARVPSFYALDVLRAVTGSIPSPDSVEREAQAATNARLPWPAPDDPALAIDAAEHDLAVLLPLLRAEPSTVEGRAQYLLSLSDSLRRSLESRHHRWVTKAWTSADGLVRPEQAVKDLLAPFSLKVRAYSASSLQDYAQCPYLFFLDAIQKLRPRQTIAPVERLDPMTRGTLVHEIYASIAAQLRGNGLLPLSEDRFTEARRIADVAIDAITAIYHDRLAPAIERVWRDQIEAIRADTNHWLRSIVADAATWTPQFFELSFGLKPLDDAELGSVVDPVILPEGWVLHGSIDLVEKHRDGSRLRVTDYKTGRDAAPAGLVVGGGETLQPLVYARVAEVMLGQPVEETRLFYATTRGGFVSRFVTPTMINRGRLDTVLREIDDAVLTPRLLPIPREDACTACEFLAVCGPYEERRSREQKDQVLVQIVGNIREMA